MVELVILFIALFVVMTTFVMFIDKIGEMFETHLHSSHHNKIECEDNGEKLVD